MIAFDVSIFRFDVVAILGAIVVGVVVSAIVIVVWGFSFVDEDKISEVTSEIADVVLVVVVAFDIIVVVDDGVEISVAAVLADSVGKSISVSIIGAAIDDVFVLDVMLGVLVFVNVVSWAWADVSVDVENGVIVVVLDFTSGVESGVVGAGVVVAVVCVVFSIVVVLVSDVPNVDSNKYIEGEDIVGIV